MSHFTVLVALPSSAKDDVLGALETALAPFDETLEIDPWDEEVDPSEIHYAVSYAIKAGILAVPDGITFVPEPQAVDPDLEQRERDARYAFIREVAARLAPETLAETLNHGGARDIWPAKVIDGKLLRATSRNPRGYWDWWALGGRWTGLLRDLVSNEDNERPFGDDGSIDRDIIRRDELDLDARSAAGTLPVTAALLDLQGEWHQPARIGWFGTTLDQQMDDATWEREWRRMIEEMPPDTVLALVDCHT